MVGHGQNSWAGSTTRVAANIPAAMIRQATSGQRGVMSSGMHWVSPSSQAWLIPDVIRLMYTVMEPAEKPIASTADARKVHRRTLADSGQSRTRVGSLRVLATSRTAYARYSAVVVSRSWIILPSA